jgi:hypothetical protein
MLMLLKTVSQNIIFSIPCTRLWNESLKFLVISVQESKAKTLDLEKIAQKLHLKIKTFAIEEILFFA